MECQKQPLVKQLLGRTESSSIDQDKPVLELTSRSSTQTKKVKEKSASKAETCSLATSKTKKLPEKQLTLKAMSIQAILATSTRTDSLLSPED